MPQVKAVKKKALGWWEMTFSKSRDSMHKFFPFFSSSSSSSLMWDPTVTVSCAFLFSIFWVGVLFLVFSMLVKELTRRRQFQPNAAKLNAKRKMYATRSEARWWASSSFCWLLRNGEEQRAPHTHWSRTPKGATANPHTHTATHTRNLKSPRKTRQTVENGLPSFLVVCCTLRYVTYFFLRFVFAWQFLNIDRASRRDDGDIE